MFDGDRVVVVWLLFPPIFDKERVASRRPNHTSILVLIAKFIYRYPRDWPRALSEGKPR